MLSGNKKKSIYFSRFQLYAQAYVLTCTLHSSQQKYLIGSWDKLYTGNILLLTKPPKYIYIYFFLLLKETWICFNHNIQLQFDNFYIEGQSCVLIYSTPLTFCAFSKFTPQNQASWKIVLPSKIPLQGLLPLPFKVCSKTLLDCSTLRRFLSAILSYMLNIPNSAEGNCLTEKENHTLCLKSDIKSKKL